MHKDIAGARVMAEADGLGRITDLNVDEIDPVKRVNGRPEEV